MTWAISHSPLSIRGVPCSSATSLSFYFLAEIPRSDVSAQAGRAGAGMTRVLGWDDVISGKKKSAEWDKNKAKGHTLLPQAEAKVPKIRRLHFCLMLSRSVKLNDRACVPQSSGTRRCKPCDPAPIPGAVNRFAGVTRSICCLPIE
jgi:hypothetical protein